jgi:hypothetical protein
MDYLDRSVSLQRLEELVLLWSWLICDVDQRLKDYRPLCPLSASTAQNFHLLELE